MFNWLREQVKRAVKAGVADALEELHRGTDSTEEAEAYLVGKLEERRALPPLERNGIPSKKR